MSTLTPEEREQRALDARAQAMAKGGYVEWDNEMKSYFVTDPEIDITYQIWQEPASTSQKAHSRCNCVDYDTGLNASCVHAQAVKIWKGLQSEGIEPAPQQVTSSFTSVNQPVPKGEAPLVDEGFLSVIAHVERLFDDLRHEVQTITENVRAVLEILQTTAISAQPQTAPLPRPVQHAETKPSKYNFRYTQQGSYKPCPKGSAMPTDASKEMSDAQWSAMHKAADRKKIDLADYVFEYYAVEPKDLGKWAASTIINMLDNE